MNLPNRRLWKQIAVVILPVALQNLLLHLDVFIDSVMLGRISQNALSAVSLAGQSQFIYSLVTCAMSCGFAIFISQYWGKRDFRTLEKLLGLSIQIQLAISAVFFAILLFFPYQVMRIFTDQADLVAAGGDYLRIISLSYPPLAFNMSLSAICKNTGHTREIMYISLITVPLDVIFNYIFIYGVCGHCAYGVPGAAIATVLVRMLSLTMVYLEFRREGFCRIRWFYLWHFSVSLFRYVMKYVLPILGNCVCYGISITAASIVIGHQIADAIAANSVLRIIAEIAGIFFSGTFSGVSIIVGSLLGAGKLKEAKLANEGLFTVTVLGGILSVIVLLLSIPLVPLLVKLTPNAAELTRWMMIIFAPTLFAKSCNAFLFATLNTGGESRITFRLDLIITVSVVMPIGIIAGLVLHAPVLLVFFLIYADELIKVPFAYRQYRKYAWLRDLTNRNPNEIPTN